MVAILTVSRLWDQVGSRLGSLPPRTSAGDCFLSDVTYKAGGRRPLPAGLLDPQTWIVPQPDRLLNALDGAPTASVGLAAWGAAVCAQADYLSDMAVDELDAAAVRAAREFHRMRAVYGPARSRAAANAERTDRRRALLAPFVAAHMSMRQIATYTGLTAADVVGTLVNERCAPNADRYLALEEAVRAGALELRSCNQLAAQFGLPTAAVTRIAAHCDVAVPVRRGGRPKRRTA